jgi:hypothetical protein
MTAASAGIPSYAQSSSSDHSELPEGFNRYTQDYAEFCALPPEKRVFYNLSDVRFRASGIRCWGYASHGEGSTSMPALSWNQKTQLQRRSESAEAPTGFSAPAKQARTPEVI